MQNNTPKAGRPVVLRPCPYCLRSFGARAMRAHVTKCGEKKRRTHAD